MILSVSSSELEVDDDCREKRYCAVAKSAPCASEIQYPEALLPALERGKKVGES